MNNLEKRQDRAAIVREMVTLSNSNDAASQNRWRELDSQQESLRVQIEQSERASALNTELSQVRNAERPNVGSAYGTPQSRSLAVRSTESYKEDFENYVRTGRMSGQMSNLGAEMRALGASGSTIVPQGFENELSIKMKALGGMTRLCRTLITDSGNPLPWPNADDTSNVGEWLTEGSPVTNADPTFSNVTLGANLLSSKQVKYSVQLEQDNAVDLVGVLQGFIATRLGRTSNLAYTLGDGSGTYGTITGLIPALVTDGTRSVLAVGANSNTGIGGDTALNTIGSDDLSNLITKVDPAYRNSPNAAFAANQSSWDKLRNTKDKYGRPLWAVSLASGVSDTLLGYKYDYNQDMAAIAAGAKSVVFGDFSQFVVRQVLGIAFVIFHELYMPNYQKAVQAFIRTDAKLLQASAFSYLVHPLS
jgi:HK97 family phage major capsid protein